MAQSPRGERPNVLLIMTDQHRPNLLSCAGNDLVPTPNIDRLAARGVRFRHAYCPYPVCVASRTALLSGLYPHSTGVIGNRDRLDWRYRTVAHHFAEHGYLSALIGKMHFNDAHKHGFEYYLSINDWLMYLGPKVRHFINEIANCAPVPRYLETVHDDGSGFPDVSDLWDGPNPWVGQIEQYDFSTVASRLEAEDHLDAFVARESAKFLRAHRDQPFFLVTSFLKPHNPFYPPPEWAEKYPLDSIRFPPVGDYSGYPPHHQERIQRNLALGEKRLRALAAGYLGNLAFADHCVGEVLDALHELDLEDNTIVVYTSDHGEMLLEHGMVGKFCFFEPSVGVPLIVSYPKQLPRNRVSDALVEYFGLYPTLSDLAGLPAPTRTTLVELPGAPAALDATSFADLVRHPDQAGPPAAFSEYNLRAPLGSYMIRTERYKYVYNQDSQAELYDLEADPGECRNLAGEAEQARRCADLQERLFAWFNPKKNRFRATA